MISTYCFVFDVIKVDVRFLCMCMAALVFVCVSGADCCDLGLPPIPEIKWLIWVPDTNAAVGIQKPENSRKKIADQKVISLIRKQYCFWAVLGYLPTPLQRGWFPLHVLCLAFGCQTDLLFCVSCAKNAGFFARVWCLRSLCVCVSEADRCYLGVLPSLQ